MGGIAESSPLSKPAGVSLRSQSRCRAMDLLLSVLRLTCIEWLHFKSTGDVGGNTLATLRVPIVGMRPEISGPKMVSKAQRSLRSTDRGFGKLAYNARR
jgi:hypothetical protein